MNPDEIRAMIDHYCILPPDDPHRRELMRLVATASEEVRAYYMAALAEQERLRLALAAGMPEMPAASSNRLLNIPDDQSTGTWPLIRIVIPLAIAATLIFAAIVSVRFWSASQRMVAMKSLAWQSLGLDVNSPAITSGAVTEPALQKALPAIPFSAELYNYGGYKLLGYAAVTIAGQPAVLTRWQHGSTTCTMLQFPLRLIPPGTGTTGVTIHLLTRVPGIAGKGMPYSVTLWPDQSGRCGWAVVLPGKQHYQPFGING